MRKAFALMMAIAAFAYGGDEVAPAYSFMPKCVDIDSVVHISVEDTNDIVDSTYNDFPSIALPDSGIFISFTGDTLLLPPGILFSERKAALHVYYRSAWERQSVELYQMKVLVNTYCSRAKDVELLYQHEIAALRKQVRRSWLEKNAGYIGFGAALIVMAVRDYALAEIIK